MPIQARSQQIHRIARERLGTFFESRNSVPQYKNAERVNAPRDRRSEERSRERIPVQFFVDDHPKGFQGMLVNGSDGGVFIETHKTAPLLSKIRIEGPGFTCKAVVCRVHWLRPEERSSRSGGMALRLLSRKQHAHGLVVPFRQSQATAV